MDREQADAVARALLDPQRQAQDEVQRKLALKQARGVRQRRVATYGLMFAIVGAAVAHFTGYRWSAGLAIGALIGYGLGWVLTRRPG